MTEPKFSVTTNHYQGFTNKQCEFYPCHDVSKFRQPDEFNCLLCYCPLVFLECPGPYKIVMDANGNQRKDCSNCKLPHDGYTKSWTLMVDSRWMNNPVYWKGDPSKADKNGKI